MPELTKSRDLRIDFARGVCLWLIILWHTPENVLRPFTLHGFAVCDQADAFVLLCGISAALAYGNKLDRVGWWGASKAAMRRVGMIYLAQLGLIAVLVALVLAGRALGQAGIEQFFWLGGQSFDAAAVVRLAFLANQPGLLGILPLYMALLSWFALVLPLVRWPLSFLGLSAGLWVAAHLYPQVFRIGPLFNVVAWQLTFTLGVVCSRYATVLRRPGFRVLDVVAIAVIAAGAWATLALPNTWEAYDQLGLPLRLLLRGRSKGDLDPGRVLSVLAFAWMIFRYLPRDGRWLRARWAMVLSGLGQRSLPVFTVGVVVTGLSSWALSAAHRSLAAEVLVNAAGFACLVAVARLPRGIPGAIRAVLARGVRRPSNGAGPAENAVAASTV